MYANGKGDRAMFVDKYAEVTAYAVDVEKRSQAMAVGQHGALPKSRSAGS